MGISVILDRDDLVKRFAAEMMFTWIQTGQLGCHFAQRMAEDPQEWGWESFTVMDVDKGRDIASNLPSPEALAEAYEAVQVVFPEREMNSNLGVLTVINDLCKTASWFWEEIPIESESRDSLEDEYLQVGLRWENPTTSDISWVLGFADLETMPYTRSAPFLSLVLRTTSELPSLEPPPDEEPGPLHLAMMQTEFDDDDDAEEKERMWEITKGLKQQQLEGDDFGFAARARVTFCLPRSAERHLCEPESR